MKKNSIIKHNYSKIQYFFWLLSGAEISILKDCPTDYNRQAGIGFTIFMTTLLAFFSGSYAGYYFGESYLSAIIFGCIWASLIFSIDRSMVVTLKKDPTLKEQTFWAPLISRGIMALLIAFIISIPLELLIFKENIDLHMDKYKLDQVYSVQQAAKRNESIDDKQLMLSNDNLVLGKVETQLSQGEPKGDPLYTTLKTNTQIKQREYDALINQLNSARTAANNAYNSVPRFYDSASDSYIKDRSSQQWRIYENKLAQRNQAQSNLNRFDKMGLNDLKKQKQDYLTEWITKLREKQDKLNESISQTSTSISKGLKIADTTKAIFKGKIEDKKGFVLRFMILEDLAQRYNKVSKQVEVSDADNAVVGVDSSEAIIGSLAVANPSATNQNNTKLEWIEEEEYNAEGATIFFLLWLIRILFFTIEILPTIAKIATPIGAYDRAIYRKERDIELELDERTSEYLKSQQIIRSIEYEAEQKQIKDRVHIENKLHKELLTEIANVQNKVARQKIEEFKNKHS